MLPILLSFGALITVSLAQAPCCIPAQWEAPTGLLEGYYVPATDEAGEIEGRDFVSYDYPNRRMMANLSITTNNKIKTAMISLSDFNKGRMYTIRGENCTSVNLAGEMPPNCFPDNATLVGTGYFGAGNNRLVFDSWTFQYMNIPVSFVVTRETCIPISETLYGFGQVAPGVKGFVSVSYVGLTLGIQDMKVFEPPQNCVHNNNITVSVGGSPGSVVGRMRRESLDI